MDRKSFGKLLAELVDEDVAVISNLERGAKKNLEPELLFKLANALNLTTLERREFFLASTGLDETHMIRQPGGVPPTGVFDTEKVLRNTAEIIGKLRIPAYVVNVYGEIILANKLALELFQIPPEVFDRARSMVAGFNALQFIFGEMLHSAIPVGYEGFVLTIVRVFREASLRYRARPYFQSLMKEFRNPKKYPWFERSWKKAALSDDDKATLIDSFSFPHALYGQLTYCATSSVWFTPYGELFLVHYLPLDAQTAGVFERLATALGTETVRVASWPEKKTV